MLRVLALDQAHVNRQTGGLRELVEKRGGEVALQPSGAGRGQVRVRDDERPARHLDDDHRERLVGGGDPGAAPGALDGKEAPRAPCRRPRPRGRPRSPGRPARSRGGARSRRRLPSSSSRWSSTATPVATWLAPPVRSMRAAPALRHSSARSTEAPRSRRRSSMRSYPRSIWRMLPIVDVPSAQKAAMSIAMPARMSGLSSRSP